MLEVVVVMVFRVVGTDSVVRNISSFGPEIISRINGILEIPKIINPFF